MILFSPRRPAGRLLMATALGLVTFAWLTPARIDWPVRAIAGWDAAALAQLVLSWIILARGYAHLHYRGSSRHDKSPAGGLQFSGTEAPSDIDFAYFAFTIGMCFQVSDVVVLSTRLRREVLLHAVLSFGYNTVILALALNLVYGLMS